MIALSVQRSFRVDEPTFHIVTIYTCESFSHVSVHQLSNINNHMGSIKL